MKEANHEKYMILFIRGPLRSQIHKDEKMVGAGAEEGGQSFSWEG